MARLEPIEIKDAPDEAKEILLEIESAFGMVPNLFKTAAHYPPLLKANWEKYKAVMVEGTLSRKAKEAIAVLVSKDNACDYCYRAHAGMLKSTGVTDEELERIENNIEKADFSPKEAALIAFARKANSAPLKVTDEEVEKVKEAGASDAEIVEVLGVMELYVGYNKFLDSLAVEIDF